ncbi:MAG: DUF192 domain-containing protein [endosymbiont of Seepiophila jonesi]|uniref:DUF192 domain-containing protein n=1 Tax=endosymbiont of Lamellibrachia luymesi TaxID=2200907 RepID=A0A370DVT7_9GAMM|nr:MAG: DUF192 domain-containing protein [endosymbiont of Lamellibrachia luymesi]RDH91716.1 MAG: DUF192 domain-containing protein [endosymbiont of Seepiophila jonesi]
MAIGGEKPLFQPLLRFTLAFLIITVLGGCSKIENEVINIGAIPAFVGVADDQESRLRGLSFRKKLSVDEGLLYVEIPLDVAFFDQDRKLINIHSMEPDDGEKSYPSAKPALYTLEMSQGWFSRNHLTPGATLHLSRPPSAQTR